MFKFKNISGIKIKNVASIRRITIGAWDHPKDPTIYARVEMPFIQIRDYLNHYNKSHHSKVSVTHFISKVLGICFERYPEYNVFLHRYAFYRRDEISVFLPAVMKQDGGTDLSGVMVSKVNEKSLKEIHDEVKEKATLLRANQDKPIQRVRRLLALFPTWICRYIIKLIDLLQYTFNIPLSVLGLPRDRFGSILISSVGAFGLEEGYIPIFPFSRTPYSIGIGKPTKRVIVRDDKPSVEETLIITFTADHRIIDGAQGAKVIRLFKRICLAPEKYL